MIEAALLSVPLPFLAGLVFALTLYRSLKSVESAGSKAYFLAFLLLYALQGLIVGLHLGYGVTALAPVQPVTASAMPPLAFLAFRGLTAEPPRRPWLHLAAPLAMAAAMGFARALVDPLLLVIFFSYGVALWRLTLSRTGEVMAETTLQRMHPTLRAARLTAGLMLFFAASDAALAVYVEVYGNRDVPLVVGMTSLAALLAVLAYYFAPEIASAKPVPVGPDAPRAEDAAVLARVEAALDGQDLYKSEDLSLARLARRAGLPAREVSAAINRATGLNVSQFVNNRRIAEACRLLRDSEAPVTRIMLDAGFSTKSNFNREFRRVTGMSPARYRAAGRTAKQTPGEGTPS